MLAAGSFILQQGLGQVAIVTKHLALGEFSLTSVL